MFINLQKPPIFNFNLNIYKPIFRLLIRHLSTSFKLPNFRKVIFKKLALNFELSLKA